MGVQAAAIEAARANVEHHYAYICTHFQTFMDGCRLCLHPAWAAAVAAHGALPLGAVT
jgi:hypothetical protein